jgi:hypothetical protein
MTIVVAISDVNFRDRLLARIIHEASAASADTRL